VKKRHWLRKGVGAALAYRALRVLARKAWPLAEKLLARRNRKRIARLVERLLRRRPVPA